MKKQSSGHRINRQDVFTVTPFPGQSREATSKPRGVHAPGFAKPTELNSGAAAAAHAQPVEMPRRGTGASRVSRKAEAGQARGRSSGAKTHVQ